MPMTTATRGNGADRARRFALLLLAALAAVSLRAAFAGEHSAVSFWLLASVLLLPLALAVPGLIARNRRTFAWATLCVTPHFIYALTEILANPPLRALATSILALSLGLVVTLVTYLRLTRAGGQ
jgi:uncharacterized membrane protein